jgi:hypothetical protein
MDFWRFEKLSRATATSALLFIAMIQSIPAHSQLTGATLSGIVTDESGALVSNAVVTITNSANGTTREVKTNGDGLYSAPNLLPGNYEVKVVAAGFETTIQKDLTLTVGADQALNFNLKVGGVTQTVEVKAERMSVDTLSSSVSATVDQRTVVELPLNGRDWTQLATLEPGVISVRAQASTGSTSNRGNRGFGDQLADSGHRPNENTYRIDGININDYSNGAPGSTLGASLGVDAIQEFSVVTTNYAAEYGRTSGAVINAITKSGTNRLHGNIYFFDRDKIFDARNFFDGNTIPPFHRAQFGGSAGGPIFKDNTWIFGDYEAVRQSQTLTFGNQLVPSDLLRTGLVCSAPDTGTCAPHTVTVDPKVAPFLALWPKANGSLVPGTNGDVAFLDTSGIKALNENYFTIRADHKISNSDALNASYFFDKAPQTNPDSVDDTIHEVSTLRQMVGITENHIFSPQLANFFRLGFSRVVGLVNSPVTAINPAAGDTSLATVPGLDAPRVNVTGLTSVGGLGYLSEYSHHWNSYQLYDDLFLTQGKHSLKLGFAFERMQYDLFARTRQNGEFSFKALNATPGVAAIEDFLTNQPASVILLDPSIRKEVGSRDSLFGGYIQDDWRAKPNLTLNLGLRYEMLTLPTEAQNGFGVLPNFYTSTTTPVHTMWKSNPTLRDFDPRVGFSWDPTRSGKTAVRAGFGIFDVLPLPYVYTIGDANTLPFTLALNAGSTSSPLPPGSFPNNLNSINFSNSAASRYVDQHPHRGYSMNWNMNIQRQITPKLFGVVGYVGSHTIHEPFSADDSNQVIPTLIAGQYVWPSPAGSGTIANANVGFIRRTDFSGTSSYNGLQAQLKYLTSRSLQVQLSYTYGKCLSDGDGAQLGDPFLNSVSSLIFFDRQSRHGACDFDIRQNLVVSYLYSLPSLKSHPSLNLLAGGWQLGGIINASTGIPFTVVLPGDPLGQNNTDPYDYPDRSRTCNPYNTGFQHNATPTYLNAGCFSVPAPGPGGGLVLGNSGRNQLYGPKLTDVDFSVFKNFPVPKVSEAFNVQFRAEAFNLFNHTNFQAPNFDIGNNVFGVGGFGVLGSTATTSRQIQLGVKVGW